jgi:hypothetical protein
MLGVYRVWCGAMLEDQEAQEAQERRQAEAPARRRLGLPTGLPNGRPKASIDIALAERSASIGCTTDEIATLLGIGRRTLHDRMKLEPEIQAAIDRGRDKGRATLRRAQWKSAMAGNTTMQIWLGKQMLGQRDRHEVDGQVSGDINVTVRLISTKPREIEGERPVGVLDAPPLGRN